MYTGAGVIVGVLAGEGGVPFGAVGGVAKEGCRMGVKGRPGVVEVRIRVGRAGEGC